MYYNPYEISKYSDKQLVDQIKKIIDQCDDTKDSVSALTDDVMRLTDVLYIYGELYTRAQKEYSLLKYENGIEETQIAYKKKAESKEKFPITYFNTLAQQEMLDKKKSEIDLQLNVNRLKYAYDATQEKINALKKKIESKKYEY